MNEDHEMKNKWEAVKGEINGFWKTRLKTRENRVKWGTQAFDYVFFKATTTTQVIEWDYMKLWLMSSLSLSLSNKRKMINESKNSCRYGRETEKNYIWPQFIKVLKISC